MNQHRKTAWTQFALRIVALVNLLLLPCLPGRTQALPKKNEAAMSPGMRITATTRAGTITITAVDELTRSYTWEGATRSVEMWPRTERWYGSLGLYYPGPGDHWKPHNGITRAIVQEGQQHFNSLKQALHWLRSHWLPLVYRDDGLAVGWGKEHSGRSLTVEVWQIYVNRKKPRSLPGSQNKKITVTFTKHESVYASLVIAVQKNHLAAVKALLDKGFNPNAKNSAGIPILLVAASRGYTPIVQALLDKGANPNTRGHEGSTALLEAAEKEHTNVIKILIAKGADVNAAYERGLLKGTTALMVAAMSGNAATIKVLLEAGAKVKAEDSQGNTALWWAASEGHKVAAEMLLKKGADVDSRDWLRPYA